MNEEKCQDWQSIVSVIALDVEKTAVLLCRNGARSYELPHLTVEGGLWETTTANMQEQIGPILKIEGQVLYRANYQEETDSCRGKAVVIMDTAEPASLSGEWFGLGALADIRLVESAYLPLIEGALHELATGVVPEQRPPWARTGWYQAAVEWMTAELIQAGWTPSGPVEPGRSWSLSYVMRMPATKDGAVEPRYFYFKTSLDLPLFVNEALVTKALAAFFPGQVPLPLAVEAEQDWLLLEDFGPLIGHGAALEDRLEILRQYAEMQLKSTENIDYLLSIGCCDRRVDWMVDAIEQLFESPESEKAVTAEELLQLRDMVKPLQRMCRRLSEYGVPDGLIHGDLHGANVAGKSGSAEPGKLIFFDWTDSAIGHPFLDMIVIFAEEDTAEREQMRDLYLSYWVDYEPLERLLEIWQIAEILAPVYHGISYVSILENVEEWGKNEMSWALPFWFKKILAQGDFIHEH